jgi:8-oxo-dGTP pyrophosphatase MutT (NUDIX family)
MDLDRIRDRLASHEPRLLPSEGLTASAVIVPLFHDAAGTLRVLFTVRTDKVGSHRGQISFPGGVVDPGDTCRECTALRELDEELGFPREAVTLLGRVSDYPTITGYLISSFVGYLGAEPALTPHDHEVAQVFAVPLADLLSGRVPGTTEVWEFQGHERAIFFYLYEDHRIWGATAAILHEFLDCICAERTGRSAIAP